MLDESTSDLDIEAVAEFYEVSADDVTNSMLRSYVSDRKESERG